MDKIYYLDPKKAQTGPAVRNDTRVLELHRQLITDETQLGIYNLMNQSIKKCMSYKQNLSKIKAFVFDVDGVFTDGSIYLMPDGSMCRTMNVLDGYAVVKAVKKDTK